MKKISRRELARAVADKLIAGADSKHLMQQLAAYLIEHKITNQTSMLLDDIAIELERKQSHVTAEVRAAFALSSDNSKGLEAYIKSVTGAGSVEMSFIEDKSVLGGVIVSTPEFEYDASVRHKLKQLANGKV